MDIQRRVFNLVRDDDINTLPGQIFDSTIMSLILLNILFVVLDTFKMPAFYTSFSSALETISVIVFSAEYLLRLWVSPLYFPQINPWRARAKYAFSFMAVIDILAVLPFYVSFFPIDLRILRALRIIRLLRLFKVNRYTAAFSTIGKVFKKRASQLLSSLFVVFLLMLIASVLMVNIENAYQPDKFKNAFSGFWWAMATLTTVGYGDIYPITPIGQILGAIIALLGIGVVAVPSGIISAGFIEVMGENSKKSVSDELGKYKSLLDKNAITPEEYAAIKKKLLDELLE